MNKNDPRTQALMYIPLYREDKSPVLHVSGNLNNPNARTKDFEKSYIYSKLRYKIE